MSERRLRAAARQRSKGYEKTNVMRTVSPVRYFFSYFAMRSRADFRSIAPSLPLAVTSFTHSSARPAVADCQFASSDAGIT